jgi:acyl-CoA reductase-like NAD-dependent aldehyde dehydrogenase
VAGIFGASGQSCVAVSRLFLQESVYEPLLEQIVEKARRIRIGDPQDETTEMGPLCTEAQRARIESAVADARADGAEILHGGKRPRDFNAGFYYEPTIVACGETEPRVVREEMFGPVLSVLKFRDEDEVIRRANDTQFGLAAGAFTRDIGRALRVAKRLRSGIAWINTYRAVSPVAPFGGYKSSGYGRESGMETVLDYTRPKTVWINTSDVPMADPFVMR